MFRGLKEEGLIEGNSNAFIGSELGDELEEMLLNGEQLVEQESNEGEEEFEERLKELKRLYKKGLISEVVYEEKQREILADY